MGKVSRWMDTQGETIFMENWCVCEGWENSEVPFPLMDAVERSRSKMYGPASFTGYAYMVRIE